MNFAFPYWNKTHSGIVNTATRSLGGDGGRSSVGPSPPSIFNTIHPIDIELGTYNKLHLCFQLSETMWCLIGYHGSNSQINDVTGGRHLGLNGRPNYRSCQDFLYNFFVNLP